MNAFGYIQLVYISKMNVCELKYAYSHMIKAIQHSFIGIYKE